MNQNQKPTMYASLFAPADDAKLFFETLAGWAKENLEALENGQKISGATAARFSWGAFNLSTHFNGNALPGWTASVHNCGAMGRLKNLQVDGQKVPFRRTADGDLSLFV